MRTDIQLDTLSPDEKRRLLVDLLRNASVTDSSHPLSHGQRALWFLYKLDPLSPAYNVTSEWRLRNVNADALAASFQRLVDRHPVLRTTFSDVDGEPKQVVQRGPNAVFAAVHCEGRNPDAVRAEMREEAARPFDLERDAPLRARLFIQSSSEATLLLTCHHIAYDHWSLAQMLGDLRAFYGALSRGRQISLPPVSAQFTDYVDWERELLAGAEGERLWRFWRERLSGPLPLLNLPTDRRRPAVQSSRGAACRSSCSPSLAGGVRRFAKAERTTPFVACLTAFAALLGRYTGQDDLLIGSPTSGRHRPEFGGVVGYFVNPVVLRISTGGDPEVRTLLGRARDAVVTAIDHSAFPFSLLVERLQPLREPGRSALFQVGCTWDTPVSGDRPPAEGESDDESTHLDLELIQAGQLGANVDLDVIFMDRGTSIDVLWRYNTDLFDEETVARMAENYEVVLEATIREPGRRLSDLPVAGTRERAMVRRSSERPAEQTDAATALELFERHAAATPDAVAVTFGESDLTYGQLNRNANAFALRFRALGVCRDAVVGLCADRGPDMIAALLGIWKAGAAYLPLDPGHPPRRLVRLVEDAGVAVVGAARHLASTFDGGQARVLVLDGEHDAAAEPIPPPAPQANNLAYVIYTSGSTGHPKGVLVEHRGLVNVALQQARLFGVDARSRVLQFSSLGFDASAFEIVMALSAGATLCVGTAAELQPGAPLLQFIDRNAVSIVVLPPSVLSAVPEASLPTLTTITVAGEACPQDLVDRWSPGRRFFNLYGPTESTIWATASDALEAGDAPVIGTAITGTTIHLLDEHMAPVPVGASGEIYIGGVGLARGYLNRPGLTAERFVPNPFADGGERLYKTGDLARRRRDGALEFVGRRDGQIKLRGFRIELGEVEAALRAVDTVAAAAVVPDASGQRLVAYLVPRQGGAIDTEVVRQQVKAQLPEYMVPSALITLDALPLNSSGKLDRQRLPTPRATGRSAIAPRTPLEEQVAAVFRDVLGVEALGVEDSFFDLGGHSLLATKLISRLRTVTSLDLPVRTIFEAPTVEGLTLALLAHEAGQLDPDALDRALAEVERL